MLPMSDQNLRKKWNESKVLTSMKPTQRKASDGYEQYLNMLQERNRLLKKLRQKDDHQVELEKREQGFALYLNGANLSQNHPHSYRSKQHLGAEYSELGATTNRSDPTGRTRPSKTADFELHVGGSNECEASDDDVIRARTAPSKRKSWAHDDAIELKVAEGEPVHVEAPSILSGKYEDDFEDSINDSEVPPPTDTLGQELSTSGTSISESGDEVAVSLGDISALRESLESDSIIRKNIEDSLQSGIISEESCLEELEGENDSSHSLVDLKGGETIVLEFGSPDPNHSKVVQGEGTSQFHPSVTRTATQSLSAIVPKRNLSPCNDGPAVKEVLEAMQVENEGINKVICTGVTPKANDAQCKMSGRPSEVVKGLTTKPNFPIKPVLLQYDVNKRTQHPAKPVSKTIPVPITSHQSTDKGEEVDQEEPASHSLTEKTLKIITDKVRLMNSRQQHRLLDLLGKLDDRLLTPAAPNPSTLDSSLSRNTTDQTQGDTDGTQNIPPDFKDSSNLQLKKHDRLKFSPMRTSKNRDVSKSGIKTSPNKVADSGTNDPKVKKGDSGNTGLKNTEIDSSQNEGFTGRRDVQDDTGSREDNPKVRPVSGRTTGLRGKLQSSTEEEIETDTKNIQDDTGFQEDNHRARPGSRRTTGLRRMLQSSTEEEIETDTRNIQDDTDFQEDNHGTRPGSCRTAGLRKMLQSSTEDEMDDISPQEDNCRSRPVSTRVTGLRGKSCKQSSLDKDTERKESLKTTAGNEGATSRVGTGRLTGIRRKLANHLMQDSSSGSDTTLVSTSTLCIDEHNETSRQKTATLAKGNRPLQLGSNTCPLPVVDASGDESLPSNTWGKSRFSSQLAHSSKILDPTDDPEVSSTPCHQTDKSRGSIDDCLASISKFDQYHLGQMSTDLQDDILETFLSEYRKKSARPRSQNLQSQDQKRSTSSAKVTPSPSGKGTPSALSNKELTPSVSSSKPEEAEYFSIPELPIGRELVINILSTWGDRFYVGLTGIEVFTASGEMADIVQVSADPIDINVLPEYDNDPRVVANLLNGVNQTRDDLHMWLTPFTPGKDHLIYMKFAIPYALALIRIWNYNKSRIHSSRGVRHIEMFLDKQMIFSGEIARASGGLTEDSEANSETILFTLDGEVLRRVSKYDPVFQNRHSTTHDYFPSSDYEIHRPKTPNLNTEMESCYRPFTAASIPALKTSDSARRILSSTQNSIAGSMIQVVLASNWGDPSFIGLTSIALLGAGNQGLVVLQSWQLTVVLPHEESNEQYYDTGKLIDGSNVTTDAAHMWVCPVPHPMTPSHNPPALTFTLNSSTALKGIRIWNYNASLEDSYKGVKLIHVYVDGSPLVGGDGKGNKGGGFLVRRAPGHVQYDFGQDILFRSQQKTQEDGPTHLPRGFIFQFQLFSSWGDPYYIGLNGLEFYDGAGNKIPLTENNIAAFPDSVNALPGITDDIRTPDKLVHGPNDTLDGRHMWLAPIIPRVINSVFVIFDEPRTISLVKLWNYGKTQNRGVKELALKVDDLLVFSGTIPATPTYARGILPTVQVPLDPFIISFSHSSHPTTSLATTKETQEGDVQFINDQQVIEAISKQRSAPNQDLRPFTSMTQSSHHILK